jgi:phosphoadenosine phosphosulfate reductase
MTALSRADRYRPDSHADLPTPLAAAYRALAPLDGVELLSKAMDEVSPGRVAVVSSFGAESAVLLDLVARIDPAAPVLFLETGMHFPETLAYRDLLIDRLRLTAVRSVAPDAAARAQADPDDALWRRDPDVCCELRKVQPLDRALAGFDVWVSGRKRFHGAERAALPSVEIEAAPDGAPRLKLNPLAGWSAADLDGYFERYALPRHPLWEAGYLSIGCAVCTAKPAPGAADRRAGRWAGRAKTECGIHRSRQAALIDR